MSIIFFFFFSSRRRHTRSLCDWSSDVCSSDLRQIEAALRFAKAKGLMLDDKLRMIDRGLSGFHGTHREKRSEERRVGKECRSRWSTYTYINMNGSHCSYTDL